MISGERGVGHYRDKEGQEEKGEGQGGAGGERREEDQVTSLNGLVRASCCWHYCGEL